MNFVVRRSKKADIVTGASSAHNTREQVAMIRPMSERKAMGRLARRRIESRNGKWLTRHCWAACHSCAHHCMGSTDDNQVNVRGNGGDQDEGDEEEDDCPQYTLESRRVKKSSLPCLNFRQSFCYCLSRSTLTSDPDAAQHNVLFLDINSVISKYLSWCFRTSYVKLFLVFAASYFAWIIAFAILYYWISLKYPMCVNSNGSMIGEGEEVRIFGDCFQLSWTTFSTVGYGLIFPATGASDFTVPTGCIFVGVLGSFEAFMGVLFAGLCTAVVFGKVLRTQNNAQVFFSDPMVVRFGKVELSDGNGGGSLSGSPSYSAWQSVEEEEDVEMGKEEECEKNIPCPSLEFRLVNRLHDVTAGEIVEAKLNCVAILDPNQRQSTKEESSTTVSNNDSSSTKQGQLKVSEQTTVGELAKVLRDTDARIAARQLAFHSADSKQPHMFTKITLDADQHPYFRRVWFGRHRLDEHSPLLTPAARQKVKLNGGYWPARMNNYKSIKNSLRFHHILVSISGTANANAAAVYAQKVYDLVDVNVGYRFVPMNYKSDDGSLKTDPYLLNAVYQQRGGGAEPFQ
mmetsp:Transcript_4007/g.7453  ORF Transcript_4007/g.7453 Transcript_4007/m.7453 type:complete len:570 (-) Transcript_4007:111-1820(-)|eukprot:CAMPEP_0183762736 /NCGR_PEP_ID=MMETSP0739-20130205/9269_1 /TAXON_ID=385413 /ORGANISM="Thalassiosira miniscula, Strain CCMP1093" /LENGTH=569 /DNA_ID=CAMNT_0026001067 /DNA_START=141 /DNA_END=1850 /DNA_ORIENTATION=+